MIEEQATQDGRTTDAPAGPREPSFGILLFTGRCGDSSESEGSGTPWSTRSPPSGTDGRRRGPQSTISRVPRFLDLAKGEPGVELLAGGGANG
jgi:hypothetical protein